ncbi:hypothetical protein CLOM_g11721, partial [Closterium sp. NIES-68]
LGQELAQNPPALDLFPPVLPLLSGVAISLTPEEVEADFRAITGQPPPQLPLKKRRKLEANGWIGVAPAGANKLLPLAEEPSEELPSQSNSSRAWGSLLNCRTGQPRWSVVY